MTVDTGSAADSPRDELNRRFAGMLSELEDAEVALTTRQRELSRELADVNTELDRLAKVKRVMLGEPPKKRAASTGGRGAQGARVNENRQKVTAWLATRENGSHFTATEVAAATGISAQGMGPILAGIERHGAIEAVGATDEGRKRYRIVASE